MRRELWDDQRKKWIALTPEEWVRQHLLKYLVVEKQFPAGRIVLEQSLVLNGMKKRADLVVYDALGKPLFLAECKAPDVAVNQQVADQAARYNLIFNVPYLMYTNGVEHRLCHYSLQNGSWAWLLEVPMFAHL